MSRRGAMEVLALASVLGDTFLPGMGGDVLDGRRHRPTPAEMTARAQERYRAGLLIKAKCGAEAKTKAEERRAKKRERWAKTLKPATHG